MSLLFLLSSCGRSAWVLRNPPWPDMYTSEQTQSLAEVRRRVPKVPVGMSQGDVIRELGKPSTVCHNGWTYHYHDNEGRPVLNSKNGEVRIEFDDRGIVTKVEDIDDAEGLYGVGRQ